MTRRRSFRKSRWSNLIVVVIGLTLATWLLLVRAEKSNAPGQETSEQSGGQLAETKPKYDFIDLQPVVDTWDASQSGTASVVIYDLDNDKTAASLNSDRVYFGASLYKLYVAYEGYRKVTDGSYDLDDAYLSGYTRGKCLDVMIRESYSPCAEKMWVELGKEALTNKLKTYGITSTNMSSLQTTAADVSIILRRIATREGLSEEHAKLYMDSMKVQPALYRRGLPTGFEDITVYNKVGWNLTREWHDAAIVELPDGHRYVVVVLTENVGMNNIAALGRAIEQKITN